MVIGFVYMRAFCSDVIGLRWPKCKPNPKALPGEMSSVTKTSLSCHGWSKVRVQILLATLLLSSVRGGCDSAPISVISVS